jgi:hypothetical protein
MQSSVVVRFESVLKGHGFSRAVSIAFSLRLYSLLKNLTSRLILGGAAVHRCDSWLVFIAAFSR